ncbi:metal ABC transporter permease [Bdellovibrio svalbardensis]|uniref:Metal ABC transporter permease n=1 Tax=Bdellovibrio svalbardensis TaxID=2972972 RepID=A0ABT6DEW5_9BACT|nr:metal ABC transporter permease [Bdellovibrio svalbardensis]MDG0815380.1 metal ABC transporter permease [Bdellovibrio svalbardensis]
MAFLELLQIYKWSLPSSILMAAVLALIGAQWTAREKSAQIFVLGQGSSLGIVLGLVINILLGTDFHWLSLLLGLILGGLTLVLSDLMVERKSDRNHIYLTLFVFFLALTYLMTALTPSLESHMASAYFGDLAVMSDTAGKISLIAALVFAVFILVNWRHLTRISFELVNHSWIHRSLKNRLFDFGTLLVTTLAIQGMGYLFTIGSLFIATTFASQRSRNLRSYTLRILTISTLGCLLGFSLSLLSTNLPTVPCVLIGQILVGICSYMKK